jgi:hypothetical protein
MGDTNLNSKLKPTIYADSGSLSLFEPGGSNVLVFQASLYSTGRPIFCTLLGVPNSSFGGKISEDGGTNAKYGFYRTDIGFLTKVSTYTNKTPECFQYIDPSPPAGVTLTYRFYMISSGGLTQMRDLYMRIIQMNY